MGAAQKEQRKTQCVRQPKAHTGQTTVQHRKSNGAKMVCPQRDGCCGSTGWGKQTGVGMVPVSIWTAAEEKGGPYEK